MTKTIETITIALELVLIASLFALITLEALSGCGEPIYHADGTFITGECIYLPYSPVEGRWK
jgi:hypothetical protein